MMNILLQEVCVNEGVRIVYNDDGCNKWTCLLKEFMSLMENDMRLNTIDVNKMFQTKHT